MSEAGAQDRVVRPLRRAPALLVSLVILAVTLWPALRDPPRDSFPLSHYPMFSEQIDKPVVHVVVGFDAAGNEHPIPPRLVANVEVMQAFATIRRAIRERRPRQLCEQVARRVYADAELANIVRLEVQSRRFDPRTYFVTPAGKKPLKQRRQAACAVPPGAGEIDS